VVNGLATLFTAETQHNGDLPAPGQQLFCSVHYHGEDFAGGAIGQSRHFSDVDRAESTANLIQVTIQGARGGWILKASPAEKLRSRPRIYLFRCGHA